MEVETQGQRKENCEAELMFEKPLTPSDVGKLNRLVIPKQHAERFFPLDGDSGESGLVLSFVDESGKTWRFRYSYWSSSQSYVLTKGWSRYVKEKKLHAGDIAYFERRRSKLAGEWMYIGWKRCRSLTEKESASEKSQRSKMGYGKRETQVYYPSRSSDSLLYIGSDNLLSGEKELRNPRVPASSKQVRLFGVNLLCPSDDLEPLTAERCYFPVKDRSVPIFSQFHFVDRSLPLWSANAPVNKKY